MYSLGNLNNLNIILILDDTTVCTYKDINEIGMLAIKSAQNHPLA